MYLNSSFFPDNKYLCSFFKAQLSKTTSWAAVLQSSCPGQLFAQNYNKSSCPGQLIAQLFQRAVVQDNYSRSFSKEYSCPGQLVGQLFQGVVVQDN